MRSLNNNANASNALGDWNDRYKQQPTEAIPSSNILYGIAAGLGTVAASFLVYGAAHHHTATVPKDPGAYVAPQKTEATDSNSANTNAGDLDTAAVAGLTSLVFLMGAIKQGSYEAEDRQLLIEQATTDPIITNGIN